MGLSAAQRPSYAGSSRKGYPELANRFRDTESTSTSSVTFENRVGESSTGTTEKIPIDARGDSDLVNRLNQWPRENRPFWLLNAEHIEASRSQQPDRNRETTQRMQRRNNLIRPTQIQDFTQF